jgi:anti-sigma regulatory factor (Ser/Thr protein kinase)
LRTVHSQEIKDEAQVGAARRAVNRFASRLGFTEDELAEIAIVVQEIGTNAAKYSGLGGRLHWTTLLGEGEATAGLELFYWDKGPGIYDVDLAQRDGVSSGGGLGTGFGAIRRFCDETELFSMPRGTTSRLSRARRTTHGTAILCRKRPAAARSAAADAGRTAAARPLWKRVGAWSRCRAGEDVNGDAFFVREHGAQTLVAAIDGLGHGRGAREASMVATDSLSDWAGEPLDEVILNVHDALRATRGAVIGAVVIDEEEGRMTYAGVGNVEVRVFNSPEPVRPIPVNGTLGARLSNLRVWPHRWAEGTTIVLATDGISATWDMNSYPGLLARSPQIAAGVLLRDYGRESDDATAVVVR